MAVKKSALYSSLWAGCDALRGGMDAAQYKDYVLVLLFMKYVSDRYAGDPDAAIVVPPGGSFADMLALRGNPEIGDRLNKIVAKLAEANDLSGIITVANFNDPEKLGTGQEMKDRLSGLVAIFARPELDFRRNRADGDDILGDAYEYLMRHFATESGKSKGQFYTPAEVSRIIARVVGADRADRAAQTVYDPTCGSGSLLLKVHDAAPHGLTIYGQEKDNATRALAVMNMVLHGAPSADIRQGNTLSSPAFRDSADQPSTFDFVVANPPFSDKAWLTGVVPETDPRFTRWGVPPRRQGDYAYLLHVAASMKPRGRAVIVMPHGVLFRGAAEGAIRRLLIKEGVIAGLIGLPANLFYGTGIPACLVVLDKAGRNARRGIHVIDASRGFAKDGPKNRLRHQDVHRIIDAATRQADVPGYARTVPLAEIERQNFNLNLPRYIDAGRRADVHDIAGHLLGGIPQADVDALGDYWAVLPSVRDALFHANGRAGYVEARLPGSEVKAAIEDTPEFAAFAAQVAAVFAGWRASHLPALRAIAPGDKPGLLIERLAEDLLARFRVIPLIDPYDAYQHMMNFWDAGMGDDVGVLATDGWAAASRISAPAEGEAPDIVLTGKPRRRLKAELIPPPLVVARYFADDAATVARLEAAADALDAEVTALAEEQGGEDGALSEATDDKGALNERLLKARMAAIREEGGPALARLERTLPKAPDAAMSAAQRAAFETAGELPAEFAAYREALALLVRANAARAAAKAGRAALDAATVARYATLSETQCKQLLVEDKWLATVEAAVTGELGRAGAALTARVRTLAERYATPLPALATAADGAAAKVRGHLERMGFSWP